jgi:hypothetical protein
VCAVCDHYTHKGERKPPLYSHTLHFSPIQSPRLLLVSTCTCTIYDYALQFSHACIRIRKKKKWMPVTAASLATAVTATIIGMPVTAGKTVQTASTPVTSQARPPATAGLLQRQGPLQQRASCDSRHLQHQEAYNSRNDSSNIKDAGNHRTACNSRAPATAGLLQQQCTSKSRKLAKAKSLQQQRCQ